MAEELSLVKCPQCGEDIWWDHTPVEPCADCLRGAFNTLRAENAALKAARRGHARGCHLKSRPPFAQPALDAWLAQGCTCGLDALLRAQEEKG